MCENPNLSLNFFESRNTVVITTLLDVDNKLDNLSYTEYRWVDGRNMRAYGGFVKRIANTKTDDDFKAYILPSVSKIDFVRISVINTSNNGDVVVTGYEDKLKFKLDNKDVIYELCKSSIVDVDNEVPDNDVPLVTNNGGLDNNTYTDNDNNNSEVESENNEDNNSLTPVDNVNSPSPESIPNNNGVEVMPNEIETSANKDSVEQEESVPVEQEESVPNTPVNESVENVSVLPNQPNTEQAVVSQTEEKPAEEEKPKSPIERIINGINNQISNLKLSTLLNGKKKEEAKVPVIESSMTDPKLLKINNVTPIVATTSPATVQDTNNPTSSGSTSSNNNLESKLNQSVSSVNNAEQGESVETTESVGSVSPNVPAVETVESNNTTTSSIPTTTPASISTEVSSVVNESPSLSLNSSTSGMSTTNSFESSKSQESSTEPSVSSLEEGISPSPTDTATPTSVSSSPTDTATPTSVSPSPTDTATPTSVSPSTTDTTTNTSTTPLNNAPKLIVGGNKSRKRRFTRGSGSRKVKTI